MIQFVRFFRFLVIFDNNHVDLDYYFSDEWYDPQTQKIALGWLLFVQYPLVGTLSQNIKKFYSFRKISLITKW